VRGSGRVVDRHRDRPAQPGTRGAHRRHAEHDVPVTGGQAAVHGRQQDRAANWGHHDGLNVIAVDVDFHEGGQCYLLDRAVLPQAVQ
jgi:hypothetical protein